MSYPISVSNPALKGLGLQEYQASRTDQTTLSEVEG